MKKGESKEEYNKSRKGYNKKYMTDLRENCREIYNEEMREWMRNNRNKKYREKAKKYFPTEELGLRFNEIKDNGSAIKKEKLVDLIYEILKEGNSGIGKKTVSSNTCWIEKEDNFMSERGYQKLGEDYVYNN